MLFKARPFLYTVSLTSNNNLWAVRTKLMFICWFLKFFFLYNSYLFYLFERRLCYYFWNLRAIMHFMLVKQLWIMLICLYGLLLPLSFLFVFIFVDANVAYNKKLFFISILKVICFALWSCRYLKQKATHTHTENIHRTLSQTFHVHSTLYQMHMYASSTREAWNHESNPWCVWSRHVKEE